MPYQLAMPVSVWPMRAGFTGDGTCAAVFFAQPLTSSNDAARIAPMIAGTA